MPKISPEQEFVWQLGRDAQWAAEVLRSATDGLLALGQPGRWVACRRERPPDLELEPQKLYVCRRRWGRNRTSLCVAQWCDGYWDVHIGTVINPHVTPRVVAVWITDDV